MMRTEWRSVKRRLVRKSCGIALCLLALLLQLILTVFRSPWRFYYTNDDKIIATYAGAGTNSVSAIAGPNLSDVAHLGFTIKSMAEHSQRNDTVAKEKDGNLHLPELIDRLPNSSSAEALSYSPSRPHRPHLVLHIGPGKMATSSLHAVFQKKESLQHLLSDNYTYRGKHDGELNINMREVFDCPVGVATSTACPLTLNFTNLLRRQRETSQNMFLLNEFFSLHDPEMLAEEVNKDWNVHIVVAYRRFYDWLPSMYSQQYRFERNQTGAYPRVNWPDQGGTKIDTFAEWYKGKQKEFVTHPTIYARNLYAQYFSFVSIFDISKYRNLAANFVCDMLPGANHTCNFFRTGGARRAAVNPSVKHDYDRLSVEAYERGLVDKSLSRKKVAESARIFQMRVRRKEAHDLPMTCLEEESRREITSLSAEAEIELFQEVLSSEKKAKIRKQCEAAMNSIKFCNVDTGKVLSDPNWVKFFGSIHSPKARNSTISFPAEVRRHTSYQGKPEMRLRTRRRSSWLRPMLDKGLKKEQ